MDVVILQPELAQLAAKALLVGSPVMTDVHKAVHPPLEDLWRSEGTQDGRLD
jgi:hypothetical protein